MHDNDNCFSSHIWMKKRPDFSCIPGKKTKQNTAKEGSFTLSLKRKMLQSSDSLLTLAGGENLEKNDTFQDDWAKCGSKISEKSTHLFSINEIQSLLCENRHRCECWGSFEGKPTSFSQRGFVDLELLGGLRARLTICAVLLRNHTRGLEAEG